ncbi:transmembrane protein 52 [Callorhinchus milii]|uniref:Transmembrane protein 52 n=1 Tax=Callorhinchus milii TaxID=7868 RepID=V9L6B2_CALMI|nr:transmembrane protein 52 [Callorhinchus milii]|eukprot:gi/632977653/ref/XP_007905467.1/ PREDICTED: transmembrane protein 52 [Callorhinchus milii]
MNQFAQTLRTALLVLCWFQVSTTEAQKNCSDRPNASSGCPSTWSNQWYVWLISLTMFLLMLCGVTASCVKCCRRAKPQTPTFPARSCEVTVIGIENANTDSNVPANISLQYPPASGEQFSVPNNRLVMAPPPYSLYAIETPPSYDEALKMAIPLDIFHPLPKPGDRENNEETNSIQETIEEPLPSSS